MIFGFSTGSLALGDFRLGIQIVAGEATAAIELSALREQELQPLLDSLDSLNLVGFSYIALHAPSRLNTLTEECLSSKLQAVLDRRWPIVMHPDVISDFALWRHFGELLCIENMDKRKTVGRTASELATYFENLPEARLCFDIGHARQIDPTMLEAETILQQFENRIQQVHLSLVNSSSTHEPLNFESIIAYQRVAHLIPKDVPVILETPVTRQQLRSEIEKCLGSAGIGISGLES
jgi:endonuclease IV